MADPSQHQEDFEESLVHEVIEENPPQEQGIRAEWKDHVGWHQKEYVHLRGAGPGPVKHNALKINNENPPHAERGDLDVTSNKAFFLEASLIVWVSVIVGVCAITFVFYRIECTKRKIRKQ